MASPDRKLLSEGQRLLAEAGVEFADEHDADYGADGETVATSVVRGSAIAKPDDEDDAAA